MGFRFRKSFRLLPGVRLNLSKTGVSTTLGVPGANVNIRGRRVRRTVGIPGSGLSHVEEYTVGADNPGPADTPVTQPSPRTAGLEFFKRLLGR